MITTIQSIAAKAGVSRTTVARVLRKDPGVAEATRERIERELKASRYRQNPLVAAWIARRGGVHPQSGPAIAFVEQADSDEVSSTWNEIRRGIAEGVAAHHGTLNVLRVEEGGMGWPRAISVARARGVEGLILGRVDVAAVGSAWLPKDFSLVGVGDHHMATPIHRVGVDWAGGLHEALMGWEDGGGDAIGFVQGCEDSEASRQWIGAYLLYQDRQPRRSRVPRLRVKGTGGDLPSWLERHEPGIVLTDSPSALAELHALQDAGIWTGRAVGLSSFQDNSRDAFCPAWATIGEGAVEFLVGLIRRNERGPQDDVVVKSYWFSIGQAMTS